MILWADGFDHYGTGSTTGTNNMLLGAYAALTNCFPSATQHRTGPFSLSVGAGSWRRVLPSPVKTAGMAAAVWFNVLPGNNTDGQIFSFRDSANRTQVALYCDTTGVLHVWRGAQTTSLGVSTYLLVASAWNHIEWKVTIDATVGAVEVRVNGVTVINLTGVNTTATTGGEVVTSQCGTTGGPSAVQNFFDDLVAWDTSGTLNNDFLGDQKVYTDYPTGDTAEVAWTPLTGTNRWSMIDEAAEDGDTTYDASSTAGDRMGVTFPALDVSVLSVKGVYFTGLAKKTDAGTCNVQLIAQSDGSEANGVDNPMTTVYTYRGDVFEVDPHTSAPWTPAKAGAAALVVKRTA